MRPETWDMQGILRFTIIMGFVSSVFDALTFVILLKVFEADAPLFQTGWFVESIATQILVIFLIRSRRLPWRANRPPKILVGTSLGALVIGITLALGPWRSLFGFAALTAPLVGVILGITSAYLIAVAATKRFAIAV